MSTRSKAARGCARGLVAAVTMLGMIGQAHSQVGINSVKLTRLLTDGERFGYCFAGLDASGRSQMQSKAPNCNQNFVTFGCAADPSKGITRSQAERNWSAGQLAFVADRPVTMLVSTNLGYNGICLVQRVDLR